MLGCCETIKMGSKKRKRDRFVEESLQCSPVASASKNNESRAK